MPYREVTENDWWRVGGHIPPTAVIVAVAAAILIPVAWPVGFAVWLAMFVGGGLFLLLRRHAKRTAYRCAVCGHEFDISVFADFGSPQVPGKKCLRYPQCGKRSWLTVLMKED